MNIFKKSTEPPAAKSSSFTSDQIIADIVTVMKHGGNDATSPFFVNNTESWYTELQEYTKLTNDLLDAVENGAERKDELNRLKKELLKGVDDIKQKTKAVLQSD